MSKYYKAEDVIKCVAQYIMTDAKRENPYVCGDIEDYIEFTEAILADLPTIEVSEDCISRKWLEEHIVVVSYTNEWRETETDEFVSWKDIKNAPSVVPSRADGEWIVKANGNNECSICGREKQNGWVNYCGFCGSRMRGKHNDE